jgi:short-subunit dehydrogenase
MRAVEYDRAAMSAFSDRYGPWAFVAGASEGLGAAHAREAAARGLSVVLAARRRPLLEKLAAELRAQHRVDTRCLELDLGAPDVADKARAATAGLEVGLLVYNASSVVPGSFVDVDVAHHLASLDVNCRGLVLLCDAFVPGMARRGRGGVLVMTSGSALAGSAHLSLYHATKAFDLVFAESLWAELAPRGVDVLALLAGGTNTQHTLDTGIDFSLLGVPIMEPADVVREAFDHLADGPAWIAGEHNRAGFGAMQPIPRRALVEGMTATVRRIYHLD